MNKSVWRYLRYYAMFLVGGFLCGAIVLALVATEAWLIQNEFVFLACIFPVWVLATWVWVTWLWIEGLPND